MGILAISNQWFNKALANLSTSCPTIQTSDIGLALMGLSVSFSSLECIDDSSLMTIPWTVAAGYECLDAAQSCKLANP